MTSSRLREEIKAEVRRLLSEVRRSKGLSMNKLAEMSGLSQALISSLESSEWNPTLDSMLRIAAALDVDLGALISQAIANSKAKRV